jgi:hypothetical protein
MLRCELDSTCCDYGSPGGSCERGNEYSFSIKIGQYIYQLIYYGLNNMVGTPTLVTA